jgi:hypothetical protein
MASKNRCQSFSIFRKITDRRQIGTGDGLNRSWKLMDSEIIDYPKTKKTAAISVH